MAVDTSMRIGGNRIGVGFLYVGALLAVVGEFPLGGTAFGAALFWVGLLSAGAGVLREYLIALDLIRE